MENKESKQVEQDIIHTVYIEETLQEEEIDELIKQGDIDESQKYF